MKKTLKLVALLAASTIAVGIFIAPPATAKVKTTACLALDTGGVDDKSFNAAAWAGALAAKSATIAVEYLPAASSADLSINIKKFVDKNCSIIFGIGFRISGEIVKAAKANPTMKFAIVDDAGMDCNADFSVCNPVANVKPLQFSTDESSFLAGYLAAGFTKTGKVATYGGAPYPTVTIFMDGFAKGVNYYNKIKGTKVVTLGWDITNKTGEFIGDFQNSAKALQTSKNFEQQGADVIFPVAGGLGGATAQNSMASKKSVVIWVDMDGFVSAPQFKSVLLTSVMKGVGTSVTTTIYEVASGKYTGKGYLGTLANRGTQLAPYHALAKKVPSALQNEVRALAKEIRAGTVKIG